MIRYTKGNLLESDAEALINTVNTMGVMGKGIALQFKEQFPVNFSIYAKACKNKELVPGQLLTVKENTLTGPKLVINFPTKTVWFRKSSYQYIEDGLAALAKEIEQKNIKSIAIPPLGCGNGGLQWDKVKALIVKYLGNLDVDIRVYEPDDNIKATLQDGPAPKEAKLTQARAMLMYALFQYERSGEYASLFVANKLAYLLQRMGENLKLKFIPYHYGPYSQQIEHVLYYLNGVYLTGFEQKTAKPFEPLVLNYDRYTEIEQFVKNNLTNEQLERLRNLSSLTEGFESAFALELLTSVDFLTLDAPNASTEELMQKIQAWSDRKMNLFKQDYLEIAQNHLRDYRNCILSS